MNPADRVTVELDLPGAGRAKVVHPGRDCMQCVIFNVKNTCQEYIHLARILEKL